MVSKLALEQPDPVGVSHPRLLQRHRFGLESIFEVDNSTPKSVRQWCWRLSLLADPGPDQIVGGQGHVCA